MGTEDKAMKTVTILLTRYSGWFGRLICGISRNKYSHASISIDGEEEIFYSFNYKGFIIEKPKKRIPKTRRAGSICIRMQVPESVFCLIEEELNQFLEKKEEYIYSRWAWRCACCISPINLKTGISAHSLLRKSCRGREPLN